MDECSIMVSEELGTGGICCRPVVWVDISGRRICDFHAKFVKPERKGDWVAV